MAEYYYYDEKGRKRKVKKSNKEVVLKEGMILHDLTLRKLYTITEVRDDKIALVDNTGWHRLLNKEYALEQIALGGIVVR